MDPPSSSAIFAQSRLSQSGRPLLCLVEGRHDVEFLRRLTANLSRDDPALPDLGAWERDGRLVFIPFGGGDVLAWSNRFAPLQCAEFHLYDREIPPETTIRRQAATRVNARPDCKAFVTTKRSLENYLHPSALDHAGGVAVEFDDESCVADCVGRQQAATFGIEPAWDQLSRRTRARFANRAKRWLNTVAVEHLTRDLLAKSDPQGEILHWLRTISRLGQDRSRRSNQSPTHLHRKSR